MIHWNPDIVAFTLPIVGIEVRWYSLCWCMALVAGYMLVHHLYHRSNVSEEKFEPLFWYCFIGILAGARLGHCLFYEPGYYLSHPLQMLLPIDEDWHFTGYQGLASHGGTLGLMLAVILYCHRQQIDVWWLLDVMGITAPLCSMFIRLGNLMNSEIVGQPTDVPWAFIFERIGPESRHPGQLYEALAYALLFVVTLTIYRRCSNIRLGSRFYFGFCLVCIFASRIFIEYVKAPQEDFEQGMLLNMGQLLSIPFVIIGAVCIWKRKPQS